MTGMHRAQRRPQNTAYEPRKWYPSQGEHADDIKATADAMRLDELGDTAYCSTPRLRVTDEADDPHICHRITGNFPATCVEVQAIRMVRVSTVNICAYSRI
jgi:hypothetical protein